MAEKKSPTLMGQGPNYLIKASSPFPHPICSTNSLPPLLEPPPTLLDCQPHQDHHHHPPLVQNPFLINSQESDLKTLINPLVSQCDLFQANLSHPTSSSSFMSNQDFSFKELSNAIAKQCKKEADFRTHFQLLSDGFGNMRWPEKMEEESMKYQNQFLFGLTGGAGGRGGGCVGIGSTTVDSNVITGMDAAAIDHVMSTEPAFRWW